MTIERPSDATLRRLADGFGFDINEEALAAYRELIDEGLAAYETVEREWGKRSPQPPDRPHYLPPPPGNRYGAWAFRCEITEATEGPLAGKRIAVKNNIAIAGLPMLNGSRLLEGYVADEDATVVRRVLDAGGTIIGATVCEDLCVSGASHTAASGPVSNPWLPTHSSGGSSSGNAALLAAGEVDMAIGGDQGGSVRVPAAWCGLVGLKPTHGLVPYTGAFPIEMTHDHLGPMAMTVTDVALLLSVLAGADGLDPRQLSLPTQADYCEGLDDGIAGLKIGLLREGFGRQRSEDAVDQSVLEAAEELAAAGAELVEVSVPEHASLGPAVWSTILTDGLVGQMLRGNGYGMNYRGRYSPTAMQAFGEGQRDRFDEVSPAVQFAALLGQYTTERFHGTLYAKAQNLALELRAAYDLAFAEVDLLCLPTSPIRATPTPTPDVALTQYIRSTFDMMENTAPFDTTGHPAISVPARVMGGRPVGLMLVGRHFDESTVLRAAKAYEDRVGPFRLAPKRSASPVSERRPPLAAGSS